MDDEAAWQGRPSTPSQGEHMSRHQAMASTGKAPSPGEGRGRAQGIAPTMDDEAAWEGRP